MPAPVLLSTPVAPLSPSDGPPFIFYYFYDFSPPLHLVVGDLRAQPEHLPFGLVQGQGPGIAHGGHILRAVSVAPRHRTGGIVTLRAVSVPHHRRDENSPDGCRRAPGQPISGRTSARHVTWGMKAHFRPKTQEQWPETGQKRAYSGERIANTRPNRS